MIPRKFFVCSIVVEDCDEWLLKECEDYSAHIMHENTKQKGRFNDVESGDVVILKYKKERNTIYVAYGKVLNRSIEDNEDLDGWTYRINVEKWIWHDDSDHTKGISRFGVQNHIVKGDQFATIKQIDSKFGLEKIKKINGNSDLYQRLLKELKMATINGNIVLYKQLLQANKNLILTGAPGTGKTYLAYEIAKAMGSTKENERVCMVQFHPSYDYTDFVEGLRPAKSGDRNFVGFERVDGVFKKFCSDALKASAQPFVFIIDEINRGEISKIFGELFFSIDPGYRGKEEYAMQTQYQNLVEQNDVFYKGFYVPDNVYIIGTMNDIDRSVESMDFAMRRRFAFKEIKASENIGMLDDLDDAIREEAINRMNGLNRAIEKIDGLSAAYHIGGAYFMKIDDYRTGEDNPWQVLWENHLQGLLYEYMRGFDEVEEKMRKLKQAYDNPDSEPDGASTDE